MIRGDDAVSNVVGAIMVAALAIVAFVMIQTTFVPVWEESDEAAYSKVLTGQLLDLRSTLQKQGDGNLGLVASPLQLAPQTSSSVFSRGGVSLGADVTLASTGGGEFSAARVLVLDDGSNRQLALNAVWTDFTNGNRIDDVDEVQHMRLRFIDPANQVKNGPKGELHFANITVIDANGQFAGDAAFFIEEYSSGYGFRTRVRNAQGTPILDQVTESLHQQHAPDFYWMDILGEALFFDAVMDAAAGPFDLVFTKSGVNVDYSITYKAAGVTVGAGGTLIEPYSSTRGGGSISIETNSLRLDKQKFVLEHGALVLEQGTASVFVGLPAISASTSGTTIGLDVTLPNIVVQNETRTGTGNLIIRSDSIRADRIIANAQAVTLVLPTSYPALWADFLGDELQKAGATTSQYTITQGTGAVTLVLSGPSADPNAYDLALDLRSSDVVVSLE